MHEPVDPPRPAPFDARAWIGHPVTGADARPLGLLSAVHADQETGLPAWAVVDDGAGGTALVPLRDARHDGATLHLPYTVEQLMTAPYPARPGPLGPDDLAALQRHYTGGATGPTGPAGPAVGTAAAPAAPAAMTRHEERLRVGVETVVTGRVRVRKRLVTEQQTITVPVTREEITVEHDDAPAAGLPGPTGVGAPGALLGEEVVEVVRHEERIVVTTEVVPVERVRVVRHVVTDPQVVGGAVRREVLEVDEDVVPGR
jgi:uncharacterized protein (TIGR02271 family)